MVAYVTNEMSVLLTTLVLPASGEIGTQAGRGH